MKYSCKVKHKIAIKSLPKTYLWIFMIKYYVTSMKIYIFYTYIHFKYKIKKNE